MQEKPKSEKPVLAWDGNEWVRAIWVPKHTHEQNTDSDWYDYNATDDTYYWPEGWYELQTHGGDAMLWHLPDGATAWQELPPAPLLNTDAEQPARAKEPR
jgi:hypothetical protein